MFVYLQADCIDYIKIKVMEELLSICDEMASAADGRFVTLGEILARYNGKELSKLDGNRDYNRLRKQLGRYSQIIDFKNGRDLRDGFKYKQGYEYFFTREEERSLLKQKEGDERRLFLTGGLQMLFDGETSREHLVEMECVERLENLCLVKLFLRYLGKRVVSFRYEQGYENLMDITMHPHLLKEYNSRWFLFGYVQEPDGRWEIVNFALDRIVYKGKDSDIRPLTDISFKKAERNFYTNYFKDIIGVTRPKDGKVEDVIIHTTDFKVHQLLRTKPLHASQVETEPFDSAAGHGKFTISVIPNIELQARLLSYGPGIYVTGEGIAPRQTKEAVAKMALSYAL